MWKQILYHPITVLAATILVGALGWSLYSQAQSWRQSNVRLDHLRQEVSQLETSITQLEESVDHSESDQAKEAIVRNELMMKQPGETIVQIPPPDEATLQQTDSDDPTSTQTPLAAWLKIIL